MKGSILFCCSLTGLCFCATAAGQEPHPTLPVSAINQSMVSDNVLYNAQGVISVNLAAGDQNAQLNAKALAANMGRGIANATVNSQQEVYRNQQHLGSAVSLIEDAAFSNASGLLSVNQASGAGNMQANGMAIAIGIEGEAVAESVLGSVVSGNGLGDLDGSPRNSQQVVSVGGTAFEGARGVVQINQLAGSGNATANNFALSVSLGAATK